MKLLLEIIVAVVLHPIALALSWIDLAGRTRLLLAWKIVWGVLCLIWGVGPLLYVLSGGNLWGYPARRRGMPDQHAHKGWRILAGAAGTVVASGELLLAAAIGILLVPTHVPAFAPVTHPVAAVKQYYLALGDSLAFGFQPNFNADQGYAMQWWSELQRHGSRSFVDYGCNGSTSGEMIKGGCPGHLLLHNYYQGPQLTAAIAFMRAHPGRVGPISLDIGADDVLPYIDPHTCQVNQPKFQAALAGLATHLTTIILPHLLHALAGPTSHPTGQLVMMNYYDPFAKKCSVAHRYIHMLNGRLAGAAARFHIPIVDVHAAFHSRIHTDADLCAYTWRCSPFLGIHPNTTGYAVITQAFERRVGY